MQGQGLVYRSTGLRPSSSLYAQWYGVATARGL
jgi:hypothetical protein